MSRPKKATVDYFPHFTTNGKTIYILESEFKNDGYAFWFKILELLGSTEHHFVDCNNKNTWKFLLAKTLLSGENAEKILDTLAEVDAIDQELWKIKIIRSQNFIDNLSTVYQRRDINVYTKTQILALKSTETPLKEVNADIKPQSKGKESIVKESKEEEAKNIFEEITKITVTNIKTFKQAIKLAKANSTDMECIARRVSQYFNECKQRGWTQYKYGKKWYKIFENLTVFLSNENLMEKFADMAKWNNVQQPRRPRGK
jgi:predicted 3-demethylubiquinone-9 3-methyltransferase (glyoxalase superfamily)